MTVAWVFNLDAEDELSRGGPHTPTNAMRARVVGLLPKLQGLMAEGDGVLWPNSEHRSGQVEAVRETVNGSAFIGRAWCPTPWALEQMRKAGLEVPRAPSAEVLRAVNHRQFAHALGQALPGARFVRTQLELDEVLSDSQTLARVSIEKNWLMKRPLGYAGRGRRKIASARMGAADVTWVEAALRTGDGLMVEPLVARELDCGLHGWLADDGALTLGQPTVQQIDASGTWQSTERAPSGGMTAHERETLEHEARLTAAALTSAGYFGPFGLDAFRWRDPEGVLHFQPRCEINARYSMGWAVGMRR